MIMMNLILIQDLSNHSHIHSHRVVLRNIAQTNFKNARLKTPRKVLIPHLDLKIALPALGRNVQEALVLLGKQMLEHTSWESLQGLPIQPDSLASELCLRWRALSRAGACIHEMILTEQQRYPWKLFSCLADPQAATCVAEDADLCLGILDSLSQNHWARYPSAEQLMSQQSLVEIEAMAMLVHDNTALIERGHASSKRASRAKEQTIAQRMLDSSAERVIRRFRAMSSGWQGQLAREIWQGTWAEPLTPTKLSMLTQHRRAQTRKAAKCNKAQPIRGPNQQGSASSRALAIAAGSLPSAARAANGFKSKRWGVINRFHIWVSAHASGGGRGRLASKHDVARYRQHMQDSTARTKYGALARIAALARQGNASKRRRSRDDPLASELRRRRQNTKRAGLPWHPKAQREALQEERRSAHSQEWHRRRACAHKAKSDAKSSHAAELDTLRAFATDSRVHGPISVFSPELQRCLLPFPASGGAAAFWWLPDICTSTWQELAKSMKHAAADIEQQWQVSHATLTAQGVPKIGPPQKPSGRHAGAGRRVGACARNTWGTFELSRVA